MDLRSTIRTGDTIFRRSFCTRMKRLKSSRSIKDDAKVSCEGGSESGRPRVGVDLGAI